MTAISFRHIALAFFAATIFGATSVQAQQLSPKDVQAVGMSGGAGAAADMLQQYCQTNPDQCKKGAKTLLFFVPGSMVDTGMDSWLGSGK